MLLTNYKPYVPEKLGLKYKSLVNLNEYYKVPVKAEKWAVKEECLNNCNEYIKNNDGEVELGWSLTIWGNLIIHLIAHAVVKLPSGKRLCITPNDLGKRSLLFFPDNSLASDSVKRMPTKFIPVVNNSLLNEYVELEQAHEETRMSGIAAITQQEASQYNIKRAYYYSMLETLAKQSTNKDDYCFCGSSKLRKKCCK